MSERSSLTQTVATEGVENRIWPMVRFATTLAIVIFATVATMTGAALVPSLLEDH